MTAPLDWLKLDAQGLVSVVAQDRMTGRLRMVAFADEAAVRATLETGEAHFYSRSRGKLWRKGEESGNALTVHEVWADCDADCLVYLVEARGPSCHTGRATCFFRRIGPDGVLQEEARDHAGPALSSLWSALEARRDESAERSYTRSLLDKGADRIGAKLREEAHELAQAIAAESDQRVVAEAADVMYHLMVGLLHRRVTLRDVQAELAGRFGVSGHAEKAARGK